VVERTYTRSKKGMAAATGAVEPTFQQLTVRARTVKLKTNREKKSMRPKVWRVHTSGSCRAKPVRKGGGRTDVRKRGRASKRTGTDTCQWEPVLEKSG